jgi:hypothetical protein
MTKDELIAKLQGPKGKHWAERILLMLLDRQTEDEQKNDTTRESNAMGFAGVDGYIGTSMAKRVKARGFITENEYNFWMRDSRGAPKIAKYWKQVNDEIEKKKASQTA